MLTFIHRQPIFLLICSFPRKPCYITYFTLAGPGDSQDKSGKLVQRYKFKWVRVHTPNIPDLNYSFVIPKQDCFAGRH